MSEPLVEIHIPLAPAAWGTVDGYPYPFLETIESFLFELDGQGRGELEDDGESMGDEYLYFLVDASEEGLLKLADEVYALPGVPAETYALVRDRDGEWGSGTRVELGGRGT